MADIEALKAHLATLSPRERAEYLLHDQSAHADLIEHDIDAGLERRRAARDVAWEEIEKRGLRAQGHAALRYCEADLPEKARLLVEEEDLAAAYDEWRRLRRTEERVPEDVDRDFIAVLERYGL